MPDSKCYIRDKDGNVVQESRNLRGIRRYVGGFRPPIIKKLAIDEIDGLSGKLCILFENGNSFETNFMSFAVLAGFVRRWWNVHGSPLLINGQDAGVVSSTHPRLMELES